MKSNSWALIKIGNSQIEMRRVREWRKVLFFKSNSVGIGKLVAKLKNVSGVTVASVVPSLSKSLQRQLDRKKTTWNEAFVTADYFSLPYRKGLGIDRFLNVLGAVSLDAKRPAVIVDLGTATTVEFFDPQKGYRGGWILPGMRMQSESLHRGTAQLPQIELASTKPNECWGRSTVESIRAGIAQNVIGLAQRAKDVSRYGRKGRYYLTGGGLALLSPREKRAIYRMGYRAAPDLLMRGLWKVAKGPIHLRDGDRGSDG